MSFVLDPARPRNSGFFPNNSDQNWTDGHQDYSKEFGRTSKTLLSLPINDSRLFL